MTKFHCWKARIRTNSTLIFNQLLTSIVASSLFLALPFATAQQPSGVALNPNGTSTISRPFDESDWAETRGPGIGLHTGDDGQAQDWARPTSSQTLGSTAFSAINGVVVKAGHSTCYGNTVIVFDAPTGIAVRYAHLLSISVATQQQVKAGIDVIGKVGNSGSGEGCGSWNPHLHISVYRNFDPNATRPTAANLQDSSSPYAAAFTFTSSRVQPCGGGSSVNYGSAGTAPRHPAGTFVIKQNDTTVYLLRGTDSNPADLHLYGIPSPDVLRNPYNQSSVGNQFDFPNVITISSNEFSAYSLGPVVSSPRSLPSNQKNEPDGTLIQATGTPEVSIVTENGKRRPFATQSAFLGLGYSFCNVKSVSASDYNSYPVGPIVDGTSNNTSFVLQAQSLNPTSGAPITVAPLDNTGQGGGGTNFNFVYPANITVQLTASQTVGSNVFAGWQLDGANIGSSNPVALTMNQAHAVTAMYANVPPSLTNFSPISGSVGTQVAISGSAFTGTTSVQFGQVPADFFEVVSDSQINAVVAVNTNTGPITITTIGGTSNSSQQFTVTQSTSPTPAFQSSGSINPASPVVGQPAQVTLNVTNVTGAPVSGILIDPEIYLSGQQVFQQSAFTNQSFATGESKAYVFSFSPQTAGQYTLKTGEFDNSWHLYSWQDSVLVFATAGQSPPPGTPLSVWWPTEGVVVSGTQPFKARLENVPLSSYIMSWSVDTGGPNPMADSTDHKEASVDLSGWTWRDAGDKWGPFAVHFTATDSTGAVINQQTVDIYVAK